jgi:hypothetical protein
MHSLTSALDGGEWRPNMTNLTETEQRETQCSTELRTWMDSLKRPKPTENGAGYGPVLDPGEHGNEALGSVKDGEFIH